MKERETTLSHTVESDSLRLRPRTSMPSLILAGDWTDTGLPATIESAVMSGDVAAQLSIVDIAILLEHLRDIFATSSRIEISPPIEFLFKQVDPIGS